MTDWAGDERELVRRCREGSDAAYAMLVREHRPRLYALAYRLTGDRLAAEDVVQETFLAAFKAIDRFDPNPSLAAWLNAITMRIARRVAVRASAKTSQSLSAFDDSPSAWHGGLGPAEPGGDGDPVAAAEAAELGARLAEAIERLPFNQRAAVVLRHMMGLDYAASAEAMSVPLNTFKSHLLRGTKTLREELALLPQRPTPKGTQGEDASRADGIRKATSGKGVSAPGSVAPAPTRRG